MPYIECGYITYRQRKWERRLSRPSRLSRLSREGCAVLEEGKFEWLYC